MHRRSARRPLKPARTSSVAVQPCEADRCGEDRRGSPSRVDGVLFGRRGGGAAGSGIDTEQRLSLHVLAERRAPHRPPPPVRHDHHGRRDVLAADAGRVPGDHRVAGGNRRTLGGDQLEVGVVSLTVLVSRWTRMPRPSAVAMAKACGCSFRMVPATGATTVVRLGLAIELLGPTISLCGWTGSWTSVIGKTRPGQGAKTFIRGDPRCPRPGCRPRGPRRPARLCRPR